MDVCVVKLDLILYRRHIISLLSPVDGVWMWSVASEVVPLGSRAVLQKAECTINNPLCQENRSTVYVNHFLYGWHYLWLRPEERLSKFSECHV